MTGHLYAVVGPSGAGKDTLISAVIRARPDIRRVRRVITRPADAGGEAHDAVSEAEFEARRAAGRFVLHWQAHGLHYGIPDTVLGMLDQGHPVLFNGSRSMLGQAARQFPALHVVHVTARPDILAARLSARGREDDRDIARRLERPAPELPAGLKLTEIDNSGPLDAAVGHLLDVLAREAA